MFDDERINIECGRIYARGILLTVILTLLYVTVRCAALSARGSLRAAVTYTEAVILIFGIAVLLIGLIRFHTGGDERAAYERHMFYKRAAKAFIIAVFGAYILTIPFTTHEMLGNLTHNHLLLMLEVVAFLYIFYSFKSKGVNINYSFISEPSKGYYRKVLLNIGALWLGLFFPFVIAGAWELVLNNSVSGAIAILVAYILSAAELSIEYFFVSLIEKMSYDDDGKGRIAIGTRIVMLVCLFNEFFYRVLRFAYVHLIASGNIAQPNIARIIAFVSRTLQQMDMLLAFLTGLAVCHLMAQLWEKRLLRTVCRIELIFLALSTVTGTLMPVCFKAFSEEQMIFFINRIVPWQSAAVSLFTIVMRILLITALTKELRAHGILWLIPVIRFIVLCVGAFLSTQGLGNEAVCFVQTVNFACIILLTFILWRCRLDENEGGSSELTI